MTASVSLLPKGIQFTRYVKALCLANGDLAAARETAAQTWGALSPPANFLRAATSAGSTKPSQAWGDELVSYQNAAGELFGVVRERSIPGRMSSLRRLPLATRLIAQTGTATAGWVKELAPKPVSELTFGASQLDPLKIASLLVVSNELLRSADPAAENWLRLALVDALIKELNLAFITPANAGIAETKPKSITSGAPTVAATAGNWSATLAALLAVFTGNLETASFVLNGKTAASLTGPSQPNLDVKGGLLSGVPAITDPSVAVGVVVLSDASEIGYGESDLRADTSQHGTLIMDGAPSGAATYSLWQKNCTALRVEQSLNWQVAKAGSTVYATGV